MDLRKRFGTDSRMEQQGIDVHFGLDAYITIARAGGTNAKYQREMMRAFRSHRRALAADAVSNEEAEQIMQEVYARTIVLGWRGVELDGETLEFTPENCVRLFREVPAVFRLIQEEAEKLANFRAEEIDAAGKD